MTPVANTLNKLCYLWINCYNLESNVDVPMKQLHRILGLQQVSCLAYIFWLWKGRKVSFIKAFDIVSFRHPQTIILSLWVFPFIKDVRWRNWDQMNSNKRNCTFKWTSKLGHSKIHSEVGDQRVYFSSHVNVKPVSRITHAVLWINVCYVFQKSIQPSINEPGDKTL